MDSILIIIITIIVTAVLWLVMTNFSFLERSQKRDTEDDSYNNSGIEIPLKDIFYEYNHESTKAWLKWIDGQDESKKQYAYDKLVQYLDLSPRQLGAITTDVVKTIVVFKKKTDAFDVLANLLKKSRAHFTQFKSIDLFYEATAVGLTKINQEKAETFLVDELGEAKFKNDLIPVQKYLVRAICALDFNPNIEKAFIRILTSPDYVEATKKELIKELERKSDFIREKIYARTLRELVNSTGTSLNKSEQVILEEVFHKLKPLITKKDYNHEIWHTLNVSCESPRIGDLITKLLAEMIKQENENLSQDQLLELISKKEDSVRTSFLESCYKRFNLTDSEKNLLKTPIKEEDLKFEKTKLNIEKSKKTRSVTPELVGDYHYLEKILSSGENGKGDKSTNSLNLILGSGQNEKLYLTRAYAANHNKSFIYMDVAQLLHSEGIVKELKNHIAGVKPCVVYVDNLDKVLNVNLEKKEASQLKSINRSIKDLSILPSISFVANIPFSKDALQAENPGLLSKFTNAASGVYNMAMTKEKPEEKERIKIIKSQIEKILSSRLNESENFVIEELITETDGMDIIELARFLHKYLEVSLVANGKLISIEQFNSRWQREEELIDTDQISDDDETNINTSTDARDPEESLSDDDAQEDEDHDATKEDEEEEVIVESKVNV